MTIETEAGLYYEFGPSDRLRIAREQAGYSQTQLALKMGISRTTVVNAENGHHKLLPAHLSAWALVTGFSKTWLETGKPPSDSDGGLPVRRGVVETPTRWLSTSPSRGGFYNDYVDYDRAA